MRVVVFDKCVLVGLVLAWAGLSAVGETNWAALNQLARERASVPIRAGEPGTRPFWNGCAKAFIHPPAFEFKSVDASTSYRYTLESETGGAQTWTESTPWQSMKADLWLALPPGYCTVKVEGLDADGKVLGFAGERKFYRAAVFKGPYPPAACDYRDAARQVYAAVYHLPQVQGWLTSDDPPKGYDLYCYPAKILSSMIRALVRHAQHTPAEAEQALRIAQKMADWLISHSQGPDAPLAYFPPTYWGDRRPVAVKNAGQNMLVYPAHAALAYLELGEETHTIRDFAAAVNIARMYVRLQQKDGTWPLKVREVDGSPVRANRLLPTEILFTVLERVGALLHDEVYTRSIDRAFDFLLKGPVATWNWDGQFEDMDPLPPYQNLQKGVAIQTAIRLFTQGQTPLAQAILDWSEDQFTVWSDPLHHMDWKNWKTPTALEQYDYYTPIDASMADMIGGFVAAYRATGDQLALEKAKALADNITRHQRPDGTIPTYFDNRGGSDWVNCMVYTALRLEDLAAATTHQSPITNHQPLTSP